MSQATMAEVLALIAKDKPKPKAKSEKKPRIKVAEPEPAEKAPKLDADQTEQLKFLCGIEDAYAFMLLFFPEDARNLYPWQIETLIQLSGYADPYNPASRLKPTKGAGLEYTLRAANGSGKDQYVLAFWSLYCICCRPNFYWIGTSATYQQLDEQTWRYIKRNAEAMNTQLWPGFLTIRKHKVECGPTGSVIKLFRSDQEGFTEGWHPLVPGGEMAIALNEVKTLDTGIIMAFKRCHGWTHWVLVSSPGEALGYFYERCAGAKGRPPEPLVLGQNYERVITYADCPHLTAEYDKIVEEFTASHPLVRSSFHAEFISTGSFVLLTLNDINIQIPRAASPLPRRAGIDWSDGGDATCISIWEGNYFVKEYNLFEKHDPTLVKAVHHILTSERVPADQVYADKGHSGNSKLQRLAELGYAANGVYNQSTPLNRRVYADRGSELAWNFRNMVLAKQLNTENWPEKLKRQCTNRTYYVKDGKIKLEEKRLYRGRVGYSPDNLDAACLAHAGVNYYVAKSAEEAVPAPAPAPMSNYTIEYNKIYGDNEPIVKLYRTSGAQQRRRAAFPSHGARHRMGDSYFRLNRR